MNKYFLELLYLVEYEYISTSANIKSFSDTEDLFKLSLLSILEDNGSQVRMCECLIFLILLTIVPDRFNLNPSCNFSSCELLSFSLFSGCIGGLFIIRSLYR